MKIEPAWDRGVGALGKDLIVKSLLLLMAQR
jgi:hypothetical protein